jgi:putative flippase GtrA
MTPARWRFLAFAGAGGFAALVNFTSRILLNTIVSFRVAVVLAYLCGMVTAYILNKLMVFAPSHRKTSEEFIRFSLVNVVAVVQVWAISVGLGEYVFPRMGMTFHPLEVAHGIGVIVPIFTSYLGHKHFSFAPAAGKEKL